jgi:hypothetical protein
VGLIQPRASPRDEQILTLIISRKVSRIPDPTGRQ